MSGYVYFICGQVGRELIVKIGYTSRHPNARLHDLQPCSPVELDIFGYFEGDVALEQKFHRTFDKCRLHGEWFHADRDGKLWQFIHYLAGYGAATRPTTEDELCSAIGDCICSNLAPHPSVDETKFLVSADTSEWPEFA